MNSLRQMLAYGEVLCRSHGLRGITLLLLGGLLVMNITFAPPAHQDAKTYVHEHGSEETGAVNLVTSIYLGYRAFDTLGETIVLMLSITGVIFLIRKAS